MAVHKRTFNSPLLQKLVVITILALALFLRAYRISEVPASLYYDEIDSGYQARSLLETFRDYRGNQSPFYVQSFLDPKTPIPVYLVAFSTAIFSVPELQIRMAAVISGVIIVWLAYLLIKLWTNNWQMAAIVSLVYATNPWAIQFSRWGHEGNSSVMMVLAGLLWLSKGWLQKSYRYLVLAIVSLSWSMYTYRPMSLFVPLFLLTVLFVYFKDWLALGLKKLLVLGIISGAIVLPFIYATTIGARDKPRISQISIFNKPETSIWVQRNRELDSGDAHNPEIGKKASRWSYLFHSKPVTWLDDFGNNYLANFSTQFLFISGDRNLRHSIGQIGVLYAIDAIALIFSIIFLTRNWKKREYRLVFYWLLLAPIPASLTSDGAAHGARLFIFSAPLLILVGFGWWELLERIRHFRTAKILFASLGVSWLLLFTFYLHRYYVHFPVESARYFGYGYKQATAKIKELENDYQRIAMVTSYDPPMMYFMFWANIHPSLVQAHGTDFSEQSQVTGQLTKYQEIYWPPGLTIDQIASYLQLDTLYLVTKTELDLDLRADDAKPPPGIKLLDVITFPDNEVAFYLITLDPNYDAK